MNIKKIVGIILAIVALSLFLLGILLWAILEMTVAAWILLPLGIVLGIIAVFLITGMLFTGY